MKGHEMLKNRELKITVDKKDKNPIEEIADTKSFEEKAEFIFRKIDKFAVKAAIFVGGYVLLDTIRQISVAKVENNH